MSTTCWQETLVAVRALQASDSKRKILNCKHQDHKAKQEEREG